MSTKTIVIDNEENDDWIRSLPGYKDEAEIIASALGGPNHNKSVQPTLKMRGTGKLTAKQS